MAPERRSGHGAAFRQAICRGYARAKPTRRQISPLAPRRPSCDSRHSYVGCRQRAPSRRSANVPTGKATSRSPAANRARALAYWTRNHFSAWSSRARAHGSRQATSGRSCLRGAGVLGWSNGDALRTLFLPRTRTPAEVRLPRSSLSRSPTAARTRALQRSAASGHPSGATVRTVTDRGILPSGRKKKRGRSMVRARPPRSCQDEAPGHCATESTRWSSTGLRSV
jgi:hypothetical protein